MTSKPRPETTADAAPVTSARKKAYRRPAVRLLGALHLLTRGATAVTNGDAGQLMMSSDRSLKQDIVRVGDHPLGIGLYLFTYKPEFRAGTAGRQFGVMADEVEAVMPQAVSTHPDGYRMVDYGMLGLTRASR